MHLVTNTLLTDDARACHPTMDPHIAPTPYPTLTWQLAATRLREMGVDVPGDGWITDVFLEDVVKHIDTIKANMVPRSLLKVTNKMVDEANKTLDAAENDAKAVWSSLHALLNDVNNGEDYGEGFDLAGRVTAVIDLTTKLRDGMDR